jgi:NDP-sugar pyrophosphorylase family protein
MNSPPLLRSSLAGLSVAILAGGRGTRLRSVVADRPKVLADVAGRPFIHYWLDVLERQGCSDIVLCAGYKAEQLRDTLGHLYGELTLWYSIEEKPLGTGGALRKALPFFQSDPVLVLNGDSFCDVNLRSFLTQHLNAGATASLVLTRVENASRFGRVEQQPDGRITAFHEKSAAPGPAWINAGIYLVRPGLLAKVAANKPVSLERDLLPRWLPKRVHGCPHDGRFIDIGTPESLAQANAFFAELNRAAA